MEGILGTRATTTSDLVLLAYIFLLLPAMIVGFVFARRKMFVPYHKFTMTGITLVNWVLIAFVMLVSYSYSVAPQLPGNLNQLYALIATIHLVSGALAQAFATYLIILMWTERTRFEGLLPSALRIRRIKTPMRVTLGLWITTVVLGLGLYFTWYVPGEGEQALVAPGATEEANPAVTSDANAQAASTEPASTEDATSDPASTESVSANVAVTEDADTTATKRAPAATEAVDDDDDDSASGPAVTEDAQARPAFTESVDDDNRDDDDNSGSGSSNSGSGSSNSGRDDNDDDD